MPPLIHKVFSIPANFRKTAGFLYEAFRFGPVRQKVPAKPLCPPPPPPLLCMKIFDKRIFLKHQCSPRKYFGTVRQKLRRKIVILPPHHLIQSFSIPELNATVKDYPTEIFGTVRQKIFDGKS